ncbi:MAG: hypothetical protein HFI68_03205 [Lachnospiraceae bacterium]|nr:hypothetical protein [Lachnospiraceae bacterium]
MKKRYLCPVCDHELTAKSFCPECRRIRREPVIYEGWLLPNESLHEGMVEETAAERSRPSGQTNPKGNYQSSRTGQASGRAVSPGKQVQAGGRVYDSRYMDACGSGHAHTYGVPNRDPHKKKRAEGSASGKVLRSFVIILVMVILALAFVKPVREMVEDLIFGTEELSDEGSREEEDSESAIVLSEEEVVAAGEPCNGYSHYDMDGSEYVNRLSGYIETLWQSETPDIEWMESNNQVYREGDYSHSYYKKDAKIWLENGVSYTVSCDTATGEVMEVSVGADTEEAFKQAFLLAVCALEPERDRNQVWEEMEIPFSSMEEVGYCMEGWGIHEVYLSGGSYYYGSLACLPENDKYR